jgi:hypothetical protein
MCLMMCRSESVTYLLFGFVWVFARPQDNSMYAYIYIYIYIYDEASKRASSSKQAGEATQNASHGNDDAARRPASSSKQAGADGASSKQASNDNDNGEEARSKQASKQATQYNIIWKCATPIVVDLFLSFFVVAQGPISNSGFHSQVHNSALGVEC